MTELVASGNEITRLILEKLGRELSGAHIGRTSLPSAHPDIFRYSFAII